MLSRNLSIIALSIMLSACAGSPANSPHYIAPNSIQPLTVLPPYPPIGSAGDQADIAAFNSREVPQSSEAWQAAYADADGFGSGYLMQIFEPALGVRLTPDSAPATFALLEKTYQDMQPIMDAAKHRFDRSRPIYRFSISNFCNIKFRVQTEFGDSYPSGHAMRGWSVGLMLAMIAPERAPDILARAAAYGDNRVTCRVHYPTDIAAGQILATVFVERLKQDSRFQSDLAAAQREYKYFLNKK